MLLNYLKVAVRALAKHKIYSAINLLGLTVSLAATLFIALYITDELRFDAFHSRADQIYRITESIESGSESRTTTLVATQIGPGAVESLPEVTNATRLMHLGRITVGYEEFRSYEPYNYAEPSFLEIFDFPLLAGDPQTALQEPNSVVITETAARKYFGEGEALGKMLYTNLGDVRVTGVLPDFPSNSHIDAPMLFSMSSGPTVFDWWSDWAPQDWSSNNLVTYLLLAEGSNPEELTDKLAQFIASHQEEPDEAIHTFALQPLRDIHFGSQDIEQELNAHESQWHYVWIFASVGALILLIAIINYVNLATARATQRRKEVGLRKVIGATRPGLIRQFVGESTVLSLLAMFLAVTLVQFLLPVFNQFTGKTLSLPLLDITTLVMLLVATLLIGLLAGTYPGLYLSRFRPTDIFRNTSVFSSRLSLRHALVVVQFVISVGMIAATLIIYEQMQYIRTKDLGYQRDQIVTIDINSGVLRAQFESVKQSLLALPEIEAVTVSSRVPSEWKMLPTVTLDDPELAQTQFLYIGADEDFLNTYQIRVEEGRNFRTAADSAKLMINQSAARLLGLDDAVGAQLTINSFHFGELEEPFTAEVIGVTADFHMQSMREAVAPMIISYRNNPLHNIDYYSLKISSPDLTQTLQKLSEISSQYDPENPIEYHFLNDKFWDLYQEDTLRGKLFATAAGLAILVACLGLFALASFTVEQRSREMSIRKVLGAKASQIVLLMGQRYLLLLAVAFLVAIPLVYWFMQSWLEEFAYRTSISPLGLLASGAIVVVLALLTVGYQTLKAAWTNPADVLRSE